MEVTLYKFSKRANSTKRPSGGVVKNVLWKEKTDLHSPTVKCASTETMKYNYMKIGDHYYWIVSEVVMPNGWIEWTGSVDAMATCADEIKETTAFIERSEVGTTMLVDPLAPAMTNGSWETIGAGEFPFISTTGTYVVTFSNLPNPAEMKRSDFLAFYQKLNSPDVIEQVETSIVNLDQLVTGAMWLPISGILTQGTVELQAGLIPTGVTVNMVDSQPMHGVVVFGNASGSSSLDCSLYTDYEMYLPFVGAVPISADDAKGSISVDIAIDPQSGGVQYIVRSGNSPIASYSGSCGVPIPVGTTSISASGAAGATIGIASSILTGNPLGALSGAASMMFGGTRTSSTGGGSGSRAGLINTNLEMRMKKRSAPEALNAKASVVGLPTYKTMKIGSLSGYVKCINASVEADQELETIQACNTYLNSGAYIE